MRSWRLAERHERCGFDWCEIPPGQPVQVITLTGVRRIMLRCVAHAQGPVDWAEIYKQRAAGDPFAERDAESFSAVAAIGLDLTALRRQTPEAAVDAIAEALESTRSDDR
jgi:hypothetical protein